LKNEFADQTLADHGSWLRVYGNIQIRDLGAGSYVDYIMRIYNHVIHLCTDLPSLA